MEENKMVEEEIEIIDDFNDKPVDTELLFPEVAPVAAPVTPVYADATYTTDTSLSTDSNIMVDSSVVDSEVVSQDPINMFNVEEQPMVAPAETPYVFDLPKEELAPAVEEVMEPLTVSTDPIASVESPDLSDELDNTLLLAKQAINPDSVIETPVKKDDEKSNKLGVIFIVILFVVLTAFIVALPYITDLVKNLK